jgi:hypothetical protein
MEPIKLTRKHWAHTALPLLAIATFAGIIVVITLFASHGPVTSRRDDLIAQSTFHTGQLIVDTNAIFGSGGSGQIQIGPTPPAPTFAALFSASSPTTTTQLYIEDSVLLHTGTEAINLVAQQNGTYDTTAAPISSRGIESAITSTRAAGANPLTNYGLVSNASGGDVNYSFFSTLGTMRQDGPAGFVNITATDVSSATIEATGEIRSTASGMGLVIDGSSSFGTGTSNTMAINSTLTTPVLLMSNASDNTILRLAQTGAGGNTWSFGSGDSAAATGPGLSIVNNTFGWETLHIQDATSGHPGILEFAGGHTGEGSTFNGSMVPSIGSCGTGSPAVLGTDRAGRITEGASATGCTISFVNAYTTPSCVCSSRTSLAVFNCVPSATQLVVTNTLATGDVVDYVCTELAP